MGTDVSEDRVGSIFGHFFMKMKAIRSSEALVATYKSALRHSPELRIV
jgi:hypothetical protein